MPQADVKGKVTITPVERKSDERGWLAELFDVEIPKGLVYTFQSKPGAVRGRHYHTRKSEWFCVLKGKVQVTLKDRASGTTTQQVLDGDGETRKIHVPPGFTHTFTTIGPGDSLVVAYVGEGFDPKDPDTFPDP